mmetsp:Transcript_49547/g.143769  ORF Transcript_49547/g.143769 Transcript_49547/m.143769 type:complete len:80 (+) Transcript_49547:833-1072(+)
MHPVARTMVLGSTLHCPLQRLTAASTHREYLCEGQVRCNCCKATAIKPCEWASALHLCWSLLLAQQEVRCYVLAADCCK